MKTNLTHCENAANPPSDTVISALNDLILIHRKEMKLTHHLTVMLVEMSENIALLKVESELAVDYIKRLCAFISTGVIFMWFLLSKILMTN